jgi:hypothetical protein
VHAFAVCSIQYGGAYVSVCVAAMRECGCNNSGSSTKHQQVVQDIACGTAHVSFLMIVL